MEIYAIKHGRSDEGKLTSVMLTIQTEQLRFGFVMNKEELGRVIDQCNDAMKKWNDEEE